MSERPGVLLAAFELSGDRHAAPVIASLKALRPDVSVFACGGPAMQGAGSELIEQTCDDSVMLLAAATRALEHRKRLGRIADWLRRHPIDALVPVDSPAANWSICRLVRRIQPRAKIIHLVAPQLWAWAPWRIGRLRRLTDHVLCLLPFEPAWFEARGVAATFVGHPAFERHVAGDDAQGAPDPSSCAIQSSADDLLVCLPGSRAGEIEANLPMMLAVVEQLRQSVGEVRCVIAAADAAAAERMEAILGRVDGGVTAAIETGRTDRSLREARAALIVSGTATLHAAAAGVPMVVVYNASPWLWHLLGRWLVRTRTFSLPNLIAEYEGLGRIVPEFVPHFNDPAPVAGALQAVWADPKLQQRQIEAITRIARAFDDLPFGPTAAKGLVEHAQLD